MVTNHPPPDDDCATAEDITLLAMALNSGKFNNFEDMIAFEEAVGRILNSVAYCQASAEALR